MSVYNDYYELRTIVMLLASKVNVKGCFLVPSYISSRGRKQIVGDNMCTPTYQRQRNVPGVTWRHIGEAPTALAARPKGSGTFQAAE
jgi:hypothetical protein